MFPDEDSTTVPPSASSPRAIASTTIAAAGRSLALPPGFACSSLSQSSMSGRDAR